MKLDVEKLNDLMTEISGGCYRDFARKTGISLTTIFKILKGQRVPGMKVINQLIEFLNSSGYDYRDYIFLP